MGLLTKRWKYKFEIENVFAFPEEGKSSKYTSEIFITRWRWEWAGSKENIQEAADQLDLHSWEDINFVDVVCVS